MLSPKHALASAAASLLLLAPLPPAMAADSAAAPPPPAVGSVGEAPFVIDEANSIPSGQERRLEQRLGVFAQETDYKIRVLTRDERRNTERLSADDIRKLWSLPDDKSVVVILDAGKGNVLRFNQGSAVAKLLPDRFFGELTGRLGNRYAVDESGENGVIEEAVDKIEVCVRKGGCNFVPGIGTDQYTATFASSLAGGCVFGFSLLTSAQYIEKKARGGDAIFKYAVGLYMPLWGTFYIGLGLNPLIQRGADFHYIAQNTGAFLATGLGVFLVWPILMKLDPPSIKM